LSLHAWGIFLWRNQGKCTFDSPTAETLELKPKRVDQPSPVTPATAMDKRQKICLLAGTTAADAPKSFVLRPLLSPHPIALNWFV